MSLIDPDERRLLKIKAWLLLRKIQRELAKAERWWADQR